jgi:hypothetical protein
MTTAVATLADSSGIITAVGLAGDRTELERPRHEVDVAKRQVVDIWRFSASSA